MVILTQCKPDDFISQFTFGNLFLKAWFNLIEPTSCWFLVEIVGPFNGLRSAGCSSRHKKRTDDFSPLSKVTLVPRVKGVELELDLATPVKKTTPAHSDFNTSIILRKKRLTHCFSPQKASGDWLKWGGSARCGTGFVFKVGRHGLKTGGAQLYGL